MPVVIPNADFDDTPPQAAELSNASQTSSEPGVKAWQPSTSARLPQMSSIIAPAFIELTGEGTKTLDKLNANTGDIDKILTGTVDGQRKNYRVAAGTDAQDLPGIVHPANYDAVINAVVFVQC